MTCKICYAHSLTDHCRICGAYHVGPYVFNSQGIEMVRAHGLPKKRAMNYFDTSHAPRVINPELLHTLIHNR